ncbi:MAG TPA: pyroglutamyl-peptidase I, partial [Beijerinckiaceae bacterium]
MTIKILVTGFGAFPGAPANPTTAILKRLERDHRRSLALAGVELRTAVLPVVYEGAEARAAAAVDDADAVLHLGLAGRRRALTLEAR